MLIKLESKNLFLRKLKTYDFNDVLEYMSDQETMRFFVEGPYNKRKVMDLLNPDGNQEHYAIVMKFNMKTIGHLDFHPWFSKDTYEIGWVINKEYRNKGYVTEAAQLMVDYAFNKLKAHRIIATCQPENLPSKSICRKLNMRLEGLFKKCIYYKANDVWWDEEFYAILDEEYRGKNEN